MEKPEHATETPDERQSQDVERQQLEKASGETKPEPEEIKSEQEQVIDMPAATDGKDTASSPDDSVDAVPAQPEQEASSASHETDDAAAPQIDEAVDNEVIKANPEDDAAPSQPLDERFDVVEADPMLDKAETVVEEIAVDVDTGEVTPDVAPPAFDSPAANASTDEQQGEDTFNDPRVATEDNDSAWEKDWPKGPPNDADPPPPDDPEVASSLPADNGIEIGEGEALDFSALDGLINPSEPDGEDFGEAKADATDLGDGIVDTRTVNPAPDDAEAASHHDVASAAAIGEGVVDPVDSSSLAGGPLHADKGGFDETPMSAEDLARIDQLAGIDNLDVFDSLGPLGGGALDPFQAGGVPGIEMDGLVPGGGVPGNELDGLGLGGFDAPGGGLGLDGFGFDASGFNDPFSSKGFDLGSIGLGGDIRTGYEGQQPNDTGGFGNNGFGSQPGSGSDSGFGNPTGVPRESFGDFGSGTSDSGGSGGGGSWTGTTSFSDFTDSDGGQVIDSYEEYQQEDGTTLIVETHHDDENGTTQTVTHLDSDGNVIEQETSHESADSGNDSGSGSDGSGGQDSSSGGGSDSSGDSGSTQDTADKGDAADSQPNPYADDYRNLDVDVSLKFSNEGLTNPVEPGGDDLRFGAERLLAFGNGIYDPRTINPAPDGDTTGGTGSGAGGNLPDPGVVDPVGPGLFAGGLGFTSGLMQAEGDDSTMTDEHGFDDFDPFFG